MLSSNHQFVANCLHHVSFPLLLHVLLTCIQVPFSVPSRSSTHAPTPPSVLPAPTPQLPPAFFSSAVSQLNSLDSFSGGERSSRTTALDTLDDLVTSQSLDAFDNFSARAPNLGLSPAALDTLDGLDSLDDFLETTPSAAVTVEANESTAELETGEKSLDDLLDELDTLEDVSDPGGQCRDVPTTGVKVVERLDRLDALDLFPSAEGATLPAVSTGGTGLDSLSDFSTNGDYCLLKTFILC